jgi:hypothetical protein
LNASGDVTPPTKPVGDNEVVKALKTVGEFVFNSVKAVVKIVITQIVTIVTTALFKEDVTKFSKDKLKVIVMVGVWYVFGFLGKKYVLVEGRKFGFWKKMRVWWYLISKETYIFLLFFFVVNQN